MKVKMKFSHVVICLIIIASAILASISLGYMFTRRSNVYGDFEDPNTKYVNYFYTSISTLNMEESDGMFIQTITADPVSEFDANINKYVVKINDVECPNVSGIAGVLTIIDKMEYKASNGSVISYCPLTITLEIMATKTNIKLSLKGSEQDVELWNTYISSNNLRIEVLKVNEEEVAHV